MNTRLFSSAAFVVVALSAHAQPGSLDITFNPGLGPSGEITCMAQETNGQIFVGGGFSAFSGTPLVDVARLNADGSVDTSFYTGVGPNLSLTSVAVQTNGEVLIAGGFSSINGVAWNQPALMRANGSLDIAYDTSRADGNGATGYIGSMLLQRDGKLLLWGTMTFAGGTQGPYNVVRLNTNGLLDATFNPVTNGNGIIAMVVQSNGQLVIGGSFTTFAGTHCNYITRLNSDGSIDSTFNTRIQDGNVVTLAVTSQNQIVIGGGFTSINGYSRNHVALLNADGGLDESFNPGLGINGTVAVVSVQAGGKILVAGQFLEPNNTSIYGVERFDTNGTLDTAFNVGIGGNSPISCMEIQPNGKVLIGGGFTSFNGTNINGIARLNNDGAVAAYPILLNPQLYFGMSLSGAVSNAYRIEWTTDIAAQSLWNPLYDVTLQSNQQFIFDFTAVAGNRFYRAVQIEQ